MLADSHRNRIRRFVQEALGCACADEVFDRLDVVSAGGEAVLGLTIGGRLLVQVHTVARGEGLTRELPRWLGEGLKLRDGLGLRRLRLVLAADNPEAIEAAARGIFERGAADAGDAHLHVLRLSALRTTLGDELLPAAAAGTHPRTKP